MGQLSIYFITNKSMQIEAIFVNMTDLHLSSDGGTWTENHLHDSTHNLCYCANEFQCKRQNLKYAHCITLKMTANFVYFVGSAISQ